MAMFDMRNNAEMGLALSATLSGATPAAGDWIDMQGWEALTFTVSTGTVTDAGTASGFAFEVQESDTTAAADATAVADADLIGTEAALTSDGLIGVQNALKEAYQPGAVWGMKRTTFGAALQLKGSDNYFFSPVLLRDGQASMQLLGKPVIFMDDMPAVASSALAIVYADFSQAYTIVDRVGLQVLRDPYSNKGFVTYYTTQRVGGDVTSFDAIAIGKVST